MARESSCLAHPNQNGKHAEELSTKSWRTSLLLALKHWSLNDFPQYLAWFWSPSFRALSISSADDWADVHAKADGEDGSWGLLRCEGGAGAARQVGRYGGDSDADHEQSEAAGRCGTSARPGRAIAARYNRAGEGQRARRAHSHWADLHRRRGSRRRARSKNSRHKTCHSLRVQRVRTGPRLSARRLSLRENENHSAG